MNTIKRKKSAPSLSLSNSKKSKSPLETLSIKGIAKPTKVKKIKAPIEPIASTSILNSNPFYTTPHALPTPPASIASSSSNSPAPSGVDPITGLLGVKKVKSKHTPTAIAAKLLRDTVSAKGKEVELRACQELVDLAARGSNGLNLNFLSIDIETWERNHECLLEIGYALLSFNQSPTGRVEITRDAQHIIIKENVRRHNGKFSPNETDHFDFGQSIILSQLATFNLLSALFATLSSNASLILLFHDHRSDIKSLALLGLPTASYPHSITVPPLSSSSSPTPIRILDTQSLFSSWKKIKGQVKLSQCLEELEIELDEKGKICVRGSGRGRRWRAHNAGNDAVATLGLFEGLMRRE